MAELLIKPYQNSWPQEFSSIRQALLVGLDDLPLKIEHIGSTSIPLLSAKPIIDIDIFFPFPKLFSEITSRMEGLGYYHNGDQGIKDREVFKRNIPKPRHPILDNITHHLYVCPIDSPELRRHLLFRDYLRMNKKARNHYEKLKYDLAEIANQDRKTYAYLKQKTITPWVDSIIELAKKQGH